MNEGKRALDAQAQWSDSTRAPVTEFRHFEHKHMNDFYFPIPLSLALCVSGRDNSA